MARQRNMSLSEEAHAVLDRQPPREIGAYVSAAVIAYDAGGASELDPDAARILEAAGPRYLARALEQRDADWRDALAYLQGSGWRPEEIRAVAGCTMGTLGRHGRPLTWLAQEMIDWWRITGGTDRVTPQRWTELAGIVQGSEMTARALYAIAAEYWAEHQEVALRLGEG
jgi:hypothetical protein